MALSPFDNKIYLTNHGAREETGLERQNMVKIGMENSRMGGTNYTGNRIGPKWKPGFTQL